MRTDMLTQNLTLASLAKILSISDLRLVLVSPILTKLMFGPVSGKWTGLGSTTIRLSKVKCLLMRGSSPLPIDPWPNKHSSLIWPYTLNSDVGSIISIKLCN